MADINVEETLKKLTLTEKVDLLAGTDFWHTKSIPEKGIPALRFTDGPNGVRGTKFFNGIRAACFPCGTSLGSTFNTKLLEEAGKKMGEEAKLKGAHVILGPTMNMQRSPLGGRGFESPSEDPVLSGLASAALIKGIQSTGVQATAKHFVCNDHEHKRNAVQVIVTERALREIYALPFQLCVRDSNPGAFMTGYNGVNGTYCSENPKIIDDLLRKEWGWDGTIMSDWYGTYSTTDAMHAGLDIEMPGPSRFRGDALKFNVSTDKVREHILDERVRGVLKLIKACAATGVPENAPELTGDTPETAELLRKIGNEGIVLLKNENNVLPLKKDKKTVVIGPNAKVATFHGGGSAALAPYYTVTPFAGISSKLETAPEYTIGAYSHKLLPLLDEVVKTADGKPGMNMKVYLEAPSVSSREVQEEYVITKTELLFVDYYNPKIKAGIWYADFDGEFVAEEDAEWEFSLIVCGTARLYINGELVVDNSINQTQGTHFFEQGTIEEKGRIHLKKGENYKVKVEFGSTPTSELSKVRALFDNGVLRVGGCPIIDGKKEIEKAAALAKDADQVIICTGLNADWESEGFDRQAMDLPGHLDELIATVADANPNTVVVVQSGTPVTMPWISKVPGLVQAWYGGNETGNSIADIVFGDANPSGKLPLSFPKTVQDNPAFLHFSTEAGRVLYGEDIYIGYRFYEYAKREVLFPFGHGLSYTSFEFSDLSVQEKDGKVTAKVTVKNTGSRKGSEVVQVYVAPKQAAQVSRPIKELRGFSKVELEAGESKSVTVEIETKYAVSYFDETRNKWCAEKGEYEIIASNSSEIKEGQALKGTITVGETTWWSGL
ncbi:hypothetical protein jhhlp_006085 [Lomentospora prolificans]|uniref:beta-glucosidase n=1 Tax=Lomentospora prolificans TaxID=41688 RepID=A0A2N3N4W8_9PEZI|nr:hypothetical protein jhhlp_006085 [Lomentospora prolificans]